MEDSEECSSSESGWTMYLASPMQEDDDEGDGEVEDGDDGGEDDNRAWSNKDEDDDDSMASDASSGPAASYKGNGKGEAKEEMQKVKSSKENLDKGGGATSKVRTKANK